MLGVQDYFDATVGKLLLYKSEKEQFKTIIKAVSLSKEPFINDVMQD